MAEPLGVVAGVMDGGVSNGAGVSDGGDAAGAAEEEDAAPPILRGGGKLSALRSGSGAPLSSSMV